MTLSRFQQRQQRRCHLQRRNGGQETSNFGVGFSINGQRSTGTEILLDGVENEYLFSPGVGEPVR